MTSLLLQDEANHYDRPSWPTFSYTPTEKSHWIHMWPTCRMHVFTCVPHVLYQFYAFTHMWWKCFTRETYVRSGKHICISRVPHVTHIDSHVTTCEAHMGSYLLALRSHVKITCEIRTTHKIHMWISCDFSVRDGNTKEVIGCCEGPCRESLKLALA